MHRRARIIVVGHAALDRIYRIETFPPEPQKVRALEHIESGGGMAANAAAAIARLGGEAVLWARVGADEAGGKIRAFLAADGVDTSYVKAIEGGRSSTTAVIVDRNGERLIVGERDHAMSLDASWLPLEDIPSAGAVLADLKWIEGASAAFIAARAAGVPAVADIDLGAGDFAEGILPVTDYAIFSGPALEAHTRAAAKSHASGDLERLEGILAAHPAMRHAGVTRGKAGYTWLARNGDHGHQPAFAVTVVDTTGAGDAFHGAFALALAEGNSEVRCARIAAAAAALSCRRLGARAGLPSRGELEKLIGEKVG